MQPKPDFLGPQFATRFQNQNVADRYHLRRGIHPRRFASWPASSQMNRAFCSMPGVEPETLRATCSMLSN